GFPGCSLGTARSHARCRSAPGEWDSCGWLPPAIRPSDPGPQAGQGNDEGTVAARADRSAGHPEKQGGCFPACILDISPLPLGLVCVDLNALVDLRACAFSPAFRDAPDRYSADWR